METRNGVVQSIVVKNFLCHKYLKVDFKKSITFIVGRNGYGKSAILDALILGLGGTAYLTQRYTNIQSYIHNQAELATIEIKIKNDGPKPYKYDEYGAYITVIREIKKNGASTYKIKSASDKLISSKHTDLDSILYAFNIQMGNPVSVLPQKVTMEFNEISDGKKYNFFLRATNLAQSEEHYNKTLEECSKAENTLKKKKKECENYFDEFTKWEKRKKNLESEEQCLADIMLLKRELNWRIIRNLENKIKKRDEDIEMIKKTWMDKDKTVPYLPDIDDSPLNAMKNNLKNVIGERNRLEHKKNQCEDQILSFNMELKNSQMSESDISDIITTEEEKLKGFNEQLQDIMSGSAAKRREEAERLVKEARTQLQETSELLKTAEADAVKADKEYDSAHELLIEVQTRQQQLEKEIDEIVFQQGVLKDEGDSVAKFGTRAARLHARVCAAADRFSRPPRGPVGKYLSVKDEVWSGALEHILGNAMGSYCVDNSEDADKLYAIIEEVYAGSNEARPAVACCSFLDLAHAARAVQPAQGCACCALRALNVDDVVVFNFLVDQFALETILLVKTDDEAMQICQCEQNVPQNCRKVVTCERSEYYPAPQYRCYGGEARPVRFLHADARAARRALDTRRGVTEAARAAATRERDERDAACRRALARRDQAKARKSELRTRMLHCKTELSQREQELQQLDAPQPQHLQEKIITSEQCLKIQRQKKDAIEQQQRDLSNKIQETKDLLDNLKKQLDGVNNEITNINETLEKMECVYKKKQSKIEETREKHKKMGEILNNMTNVQNTYRSTTEENIKKLKDKAIKDGPRIEEPRGEKELKELLKEKEAELNSFAKARYDRDIVDEELGKARDKYDKVNNNLIQLEKLIKETTRQVESHLRPCLVRLNCVSLHVKNRFQEILSSRGIQGNLRIDNVSRKLWIDQGERQASGGERTFALVAFLVALQDCVDMPFFFMDEFNKFLDGVNYQRALEFLLAAARMRPACQYVFITPNEPPGLRSSSDLDILTMSSQVESST